VSIHRCLNGWQATRRYCRLNYYLTPESYNGQQGALEGPGTFQPDGQITVEIKFLIPAKSQVTPPATYRLSDFSAHVSGRVLLEYFDILIELQSSQEEYSITRNRIPGFAVKRSLPIVRRVS